LAARPTPGGRGLARALLVLLMLTFTSTPSRAQGESLEYAVKATYLYKFAPFVEWPPSAFPGGTSPLVVCVVGTDPFGPVLDRAVTGQHIGERPIVVERLAAYSPERACHVMYAMGSEAQSAAAAVDMARGHPVLTITDAARGSDARGVIHFIVQDNRVRFEIDDRAAAQNDLRVSSKLLSLALGVRPRS
jgi:hypothetical protein